MLSTEVYEINGHFIHVIIATLIEKYIFLPVIVRGGMQSAFVPAPTTIARPCKPVICLPAMWRILRVKCLLSSMNFYNADL